MSTSIWSEQSTEQARLLNPAFLASLVWGCANGYSKVDKRGVPYPLLFVAMPAVLQKATREILPRSARTSLAAWLVDNPQVHAGFAERAMALVPLVKAGILFGANGQLLDAPSPRILAVRRPRSLARFLREASNEVATCMKKAEFVGKWFASSGDHTTIMALWGVTV